MKELYDSVRSQVQGVIELKILLIYLGRRGGGPVYAYEVARAVSKKANMVCLLSDQIDNKQTWLDSGLKCYFVPTFSSVLTAGLSLINIRNRINIKKIIEHELPDLVYYPMGHLWDPFINMDIARRIPKVLTVHDPHPHLGEHNLIIQFFAKWERKQADRIVVLHNEAVNELEEQGFSKTIIDVIPHGLFSYYKDHSLNHPNRSQSEGINILFFGRILEYKGLDILLSAFPLIKARIPTARLIIAGEGNLKPYKHLISKLSDIEVYNRWIEDHEVADFFTKADLLVVPYLDASQSGVIPIAYSMGVPVVASKVGGLVEQVIDRRSGLLANPGDPVDLSNKCIEILINPDLYSQLVIGVRLLADTLMNWDIIADKLIDSFIKTLNKA